MRVLSIAVLGVAMAAFAGTAGAQDTKTDYAKKIIGKWEQTTKSEGGLLSGITVEFMEKKLIATLKDAPDEKIEGTYVIEKDKLMVELTVMGKTVKETLTIKKLTDDMLEVEDKEKQVEVFKKKK